MITNPDPSRPGHDPDAVGVELEMVEDLAPRRLGLGSHQDQHPLLRFGQHHLVGRHALFPAADPVDVDVDPAMASMGELAGRAGEPGRAQILDGGDAVELVQPQARLTQQLLEERIAHLDRRSALGGSLIHLHRGEGRPVNAIAPGIGADQQHDVTGSVRGGAAQPIMGHDPDAHGVDDRVIAVAGVEMDLAHDRRAPEAVTVAPDAGDHALEEMAVVSRVERTKAKRIEDRDRSGAHGEHVAEDAAHTGGRPLVRLDRRRMIVRLDLEHNGEAVADVDRARVLARPLQNIRTFGGQLAE